MTTNQTARVLELLKRFNNGEKVCIDALQQDALWYGKSEKTIRRDLDVIKEYFPEAFELIRGGHGEKGCYKAVTRGAFDNLLKPELISLLVQAFSIAQKNNFFDNFTMDTTDKKILESKVKETSKCYVFKNKPFESQKDDMVLFKKLERAIQHQKYLILEYPQKNTFMKVEVKPYKIVFMNENFYLACEVDHAAYAFSIFRISKIKSIEDTPKTYQKNPDIEEFIQAMQTPFPLYTKDFRLHLIEVVLEVDASKAFYFKAKKYLKSQSIVEEKENGNLIICYKVTQLREMEELLHKWIPYVKVIAPLPLKEKLHQELTEYLTNS
ncbi:MAG: WYL domain-containing protein [Epsilonproteobacteria bacterium]|nr:WYL domain-containing protein [Campylobacterota bacterium]